MKEQTWLTSRTPESMLMHLTHERDTTGKTLIEPIHVERNPPLISDRKLRLFACACCRQIWDKMTEQSSQFVVEVAEQCADGQASEEDLYDAVDSLIDVARANANVRNPVVAAGLDCTLAPRDAAKYAAHSVVRAAERTAAPGVRAWIAASDAAKRTQSHILRDIVGNPFKPVSFQDSWKTRTVLQLAQTIYDDRQYDLMPILGDALEEAGCNSEDILQHCRGGGVHVRGCWVVDLILGKE